MADIEPDDLNLENLVPRSCRPKALSLEASLPRSSPRSMIIIEEE